MSRAADLTKDLVRRLNYTQISTCLNCGLLTYAWSSCVSKLMSSYRMKSNENKSWSHCSYSVCMYSMYAVVGLHVLPVKVAVLTPHLFQISVSPLKSHLFVSQGWLIVAFGLTSDWAQAVLLSLLVYWFIVSFNTFVKLCYLSCQQPTFVLSLTLNCFCCAPRDNEDR